MAKLSYLLILIITSSLGSCLRFVDYVGLCGDRSSSSYDDACFFDKADETCTEIGVRTMTYAIRYTSNRTTVTPEDCLYFALAAPLEGEGFGLQFEYPLLCFANGTQTRGVFSLADSTCRFEFKDFAPTDICVGSQRVFEASFMGSNDPKICTNSALTSGDIFYGNPVTCYEKNGSLIASWLYPDETCSISPIVCPNPEIYKWNSAAKICEPNDDCGFFGEERAGFRNVVYNDSFYAERSRISCDYKTVSNQAVLWIESLNSTGYLDILPSSSSLYVSNSLVSDNAWDDLSDIEGAEQRLLSHVLLKQNSSVTDRVGSLTPFKVTAKVPKNIALGQLPDGTFTKNVEAAFNRTVVRVTLTA